MNFVFFFKDFIQLPLERGEGKKKREGKKHQCVATFLMPPTGNPAQNPGMCPDGELSQQTFASQSGAQSADPHQPGLIC